MGLFIVLCTGSNVEMLIPFIMQEGDFLLNFFQHVVKVGILLLTC